MMNSHPRAFVLQKLERQNFVVRKFTHLILKILKIKFGTRQYHFAGVSKLFRKTLKLCIMDTVLLKHITSPFSFLKCQ